MTTPDRECNELESLLCTLDDERPERLQHLLEDFSDIAARHHDGEIVVSRTCEDLQRVGDAIRAATESLPGPTARERVAAGDHTGAARELEARLWDLQRLRPRRFAAVLEDFSDVVTYDGSELSIVRSPEAAERVLDAADAATQEAGDLV